MGSKYNRRTKQDPPMWSSTKSVQHWTNWSSPVQKKKKMPDNLSSTSSFEKEKSQQILKTFTRRKKTPSKKPHKAHWDDELMPKQQVEQQTNQNTAWNEPIVRTGTNTLHLGSKLLLSKRNVFSRQLQHPRPIFKTQKSEKIRWKRTRVHNITTLHDDVKEGLLYCNLLINPFEGDFECAKHLGAIIVMFQYPLCPSSTVILQRFLTLTSLFSLKDAPDCCRRLQPLLYIQVGRGLVEHVNVRLKGTVSSGRVPCMLSVVGRSGTASSTRVHMNLLLTAMRAKYDSCVYLKNYTGIWLSSRSVAVTNR